MWSILKHKPLILTGALIALVVLVAAACGGGSSEEVAKLQGQVAQKDTEIAQAKAKVQELEAAKSVVQAGQLQPAPAGAQPTGWDTAYSQRLGIKLLATYDSSGPAAWDPAKHPNVFLTSLGPGYGGVLSKNKLPGLVIIDADTKEVVAYRTYDLGIESYWENHGQGISPDGQWFYVPTGDPQAKKEGKDPGRLLVVNAKTLKLHQLISTKGMVHHVKAFKDGSGRDIVMAEDFNWQAPAFGIDPGSGVYALDPNDNHRVIGGINADSLQANPYLAFASPDGKYVSIGLPPGPYIDLVHKIKGSWALVDTATWKPVKYFPGGYDPIWTAWAPDGKTAYLCDGGSDEVFKLDVEKKQIVGFSRSSVHGMYGCNLGWKADELWTIEKGEASHNRGKNIGLVNVKTMRPVDIWNTGWVRADHAQVHPNPDVNELWATANSSFEVVVWDMGKRQVTSRIPMPLGGSTHGGAFARYNSDFTGELLSDQNGLHGPALKKQLELWQAPAPSQAPAPPRPGD